MNNTNLTSKNNTESFSLGFQAPDPYLALSEEEKQAKATLTSDTCVIRHDTQTDYFIRAVLLVPIKGREELFLWGVWVSLSQQNFERHNDTWDSHDESDVYTGYLCNQLPGYPDTLFIKAKMHPSKETRPLLRLERGGGHPLAEQKYEGMSVEMARNLVRLATGG